MSGTGRCASSIRAVSRPVLPCQVSGDLADIAEGRRHQQELRLGQAEQRHLPRPAALAVGIEVELVHHDLADVGAARPARRAMFASTSAVQQTMGASELTDASPVNIPTFSAPKIAQSAKNFSETSALIGAV